MKTDQRFLSQVYLFSTKIALTRQIMLRNSKVVCEQSLNSLLFLNIKAIWNKKKLHIYLIFSTNFTFTPKIRKVGQSLWLVQLMEIG